MAGESNNSNDGTSLLKEGRRLLESSDVGAAIEAFSRVIEAEPRRAVAYRLRGSAHLRQRAYDLAIADLDQAIEITPKDAVAFYLRGRARQLTKDPAGAVADFDQAIRLKPDYLKAFQCRESVQKQAPSISAGVEQPSPSAPNGPGRWPFYGGLAFGMLLICLFALNARDPGFLFRHSDASTPNLQAAAQDSSFRSAPPQSAGPLPKIPATPITSAPQHAPMGASDKIPQEVSDKLHQASMAARACIRASLPRAYSSGVYGNEELEFFFRSLCYDAFAQLSAEAYQAVGLERDDESASIVFRALIWQTVAPEEWEKGMAKFKRLLNQQR